MTSRHWDTIRDTDDIGDPRHEPELALSALHTPYCERRKQTARQSRFKSTYAQSCSEKKKHFLDYSNKNVVLWQKLRICKDSSPHKELICAVCHSVLYSSVCLSFIIKLKQPTSCWESRVGNSFKISLIAVTPRLLRYSIRQYRHTHMTSHLMSDPRSEDE